MGLGWHGQDRAQRVYCVVEPLGGEHEADELGLLNRGPPAAAARALKAQLLLYGKVVRAPDDDVLRQLTFIQNSTKAATEHYVRRVGRPRNEWAVMLRKESYKMNPRADEIVLDRYTWAQEVHRYCSIQSCLK